MKVYFVTDYFWPGIGGLENSTAYLAKCLGKKIPVEVFTTTGNSGVELATSFKINRFSASDKNAYRSMARQIERDGKATAVCFMGFSDRWTDEHLEFIQEAKGGRANKVLFKVPSVKEFSYYVHNRKRLEKFLFVDHILCLNDAIRDELLEKGVPEDKLIARTNGVPTDRFIPLPKAGKIALRKQFGLDDKLTFVFTGRFAARKRVDLLVEAFAKVKSVNLMLVGYFDNRFDQGSSFSIPTDQTNIRLFKPTFDIVPFLQVADVYVSASKAEGMSNALLEAMSCGLPALVSDIKGHREAILPGQNGRLFKWEDRDDLFKGIHWFVQQRDQYARLSQQARNIVLKDYNIESVAAIYFNLINN
jgi:glycosyltransferase involved in cell wall biosynthesis